MIVKNNMGSRYFCKHRVPFLCEITEQPASRAVRVKAEQRSSRYGASAYIVALERVLKPLYNPSADNRRQSSSSAERTPR